MPVNSTVPRWLLFSFRLWDCDEASVRFIAVSKYLWLSCVTSVLITLFNDDSSIQAHLSFQPWAPASSLSKDLNYRMVTLGGDSDWSCRGGLEIEALSLHCTGPGWWSAETEQVQMSHFVNKWLQQLVIITDGNPLIHFFRFGEVFHKQTSYQEKCPRESAAASM